MRILVGDIAEYLHDLRISKEFLNRMQNVLARKRINDKLEFIKIKNICSSKSPRMVCKGKS